MTLTTFEFYSTQYKGVLLNEDTFNRLVIKASFFLKKSPFNLEFKNDKPVPENIQMAACAVSEALKVNEDGGDIASQSVGPWSKTFNRVAKTDNQRLLDAALFYYDPGEVRWV